MVSGKLAASGDYRAIRQQLNDRPFVVRIDCADARGSPPASCGSRPSSPSRSPATGPSRPQSGRLVAPALTPRDRARAGHPALARRAAGRLARERLRVPRDRDRRVTAIFSLTLRQLAGSRRLWLVLALVALPILAAVLFHVGETETTSARFADNVTTTLVASGILPLVMLLFATSAFGNELVDRTLVYITLKPLARWRIVVPKLVAALVVGGIPVAASGFRRSPSSRTEPWRARSRPGSGCWWAPRRTRRSSRGRGSRRGTRSSSASCTSSSGRRPSPRTSTGSASSASAATPSR